MTKAQLQEQLKTLKNFTWGCVHKIKEEWPIECLVEYNGATGEYDKNWPPAEIAEILDG